MEFRPSKDFSRQGKIDLIGGLMCLQTSTQLELQSLNNPDLDLEKNLVFCMSEVG